MGLKHGMTILGGQTFPGLAEGMLSEREKVEKILDLFQAIAPMKFSEESQSLIKKAFPIVWGTTTNDPLPFYNTDIKGESLLSGAQRLGDDIQVAFTDQEHVASLKDAVEKYDVSVLSFDAAGYILRRQFRHNGYLFIEREKPLLPLTEPLLA